MKTIKKTKKDFMKNMTFEGIKQIIYGHNVKWLIMLSEMVHNSIDAGATQIEITMKKGKFQIKDNGTGVKDFDKMLALGVHDHQDTTVIGLYGYGFKSVYGTMKGNCSITSIHKGKKKVQKFSEKNFPGTMTIENTDLPSGTAITFTGIDKAIPKDMQNMVDKINFMFTPALKNGVSINMITAKKEYKLTPYSFPAMQAETEFTLNISGKKAEVKLGVVKNGVPNAHPGLIFEFGPHYFSNVTIKGLASITGVIKLNMDDSWTLNMNKTNFKNNKDKKQLIKAIEEKAAYQITMANNYSHNLILEKLAILIGNSINKIFDQDTSETVDASEFEGNTEGYLIEEGEEPVHDEPTPTPEPVGPLKGEAKKDLTDGNPAYKAKKKKNSPLVINYHNYDSETSLGEISLLDNNVIVTLNTYHLFFKDIEDSGSLSAHAKIITPYIGSMLIEKAKEDPDEAKHYIPALVSEDSHASLIAKYFVPTTEGAKS